VERESLDLLIDSAIAIGIGLFIGLEREHSSASLDQATSENGSQASARESMLGVRTFALLALFGSVIGTFAQENPWVPVAALLAVGGLIAIVTNTATKEGRGLTTEVAALATFMLGAMIHRERGLSVTLAIATALLLISKPWFRTFVPRVRRMDLVSTLQLAIVLAIVLPLLPDEARDPWHVLSPRKIGIFVALIAGISYVGYVLHRLLGDKRAAWLSGLVGGLASSTAVTAAMAQQAHRSPSLRVHSQLATLLASAVMCVRVFVVSAIIAVDVAAQLAVPLAAMAAPLLAGAIWKWRATKSDRAPAESSDRSDAHELELKNPFSLIPAIKWGALFAAILVVSAIAKDTIGNAGIVATAAASGLVDVDVITIAAARQVQAGQTAQGLAALAITVAVVSNTIVKATIAWVGGKRAFGADIAKVFGVSIVCGIAAALTRI
jgi:uncharacterized membrane protein (DUF4010 family)